MARSLYACANFSGLWLLVLLKVTRVCNMEVRKASTGSKNSKSLSGSGKRSFQLSTMLSSVLHKKSNSLQARIQLLIMEKKLIHGVFVLFQTYAVTATSPRWPRPPLQRPLFRSRQTVHAFSSILSSIAFILQPLYNDHLTTMTTAAKLHKTPFFLCVKGHQN